MDQLTDTLAAADAHLDDDLLDALDELLPPGTDVVATDPSNVPVELAVGYRRRPRRTAAVSRA